VDKDFIKKVTDAEVGLKILESLPRPALVKIVQEELTSLMGGTNARLTWSSSVPTNFMLCGLQGAGKTTMAANWAGYLISREKSHAGRRDIYRPAAIKQLQEVGEQVKVPVYEKGSGTP
jgi:signal recognition particle subunit SRP54